MRNISDKSCRKITAQQKRFFENHAVYEIMSKKYRRVGHPTDDNMAHALCMLDT